MIVSDDDISVRSDGCRVVFTLQCSLMMSEWPISVMVVGPCLVCRTNLFHGTWGMLLLEIDDGEGSEAHLQTVPREDKK